MEKLKDTIELMKSENYKDRFKAEYWQAKIRYDNLKSMLDKWDKGELDFEPTYDKMTYDIQLRIMEEYIMILNMRAYKEKIDLQEELREKIKKSVTKHMGYEDVLMIKQNNIIFAIPTDKRMELYLYYWFLNCKKEIKKSLNLELVFDSINTDYKDDILKHNSNIRNNKDLVAMNKVVNILYLDNLWQYKKVCVKKHIKEIKKYL